MADDELSTEAEALPLAPETDPGPGARRRALGAALAVVAVLAIAAGAVAVARGDRSDAPPALPVALGASAGESGRMAADAMLAWVRYEAGPGLPVLGGEAEAHRVRAAVTADSVARLASALGVDGIPEQDGTIWRVAGAGGTVEADAAGGWWWFSPDAARGGGMSGAPGATGSAGHDTGAAVEAPVDPCAPDVPRCERSEVPPADEVVCIAIAPPPPGCEPSGSDGTDQGAVPDDAIPRPTPVVPSEPADLPSEDEARRVALEVAAAAGLDADAATVHVDGPHDAWYVTVEPVHDGVPVSGWALHLAVGPDGVRHASGTMATTEPVGSYPLIDTTAAIGRLNALAGGHGGDGGPGVPVPDRAADASRTGPAAEATASCPTGPADCAVAADAAPTPSADDASAADAVAQCADLPVADDGSVTSCSACTAAPGHDAGDCVDPAVPTTLAADPPTGPQAEPGPLVVTLREAARVLVVMPAHDGSGDRYLVPGYRFGADDGTLVEVVALADDALAPAPSTETTVPPTDVPDTAVDPALPPGAEPGSPACEVWSAEDGAGTRHTVQPCPNVIPPVGPDPVVLPAGAEPALGVPYLVDVDVACGGLVLGDRVWVLEDGDRSGWSTPHEGGALTLEAPDRATFLGDAAGAKRATFRPLGPEEEPGCTPQPRR